MAADVWLRRIAVVAAVVAVAVVGTTVAAAASPRIRAVLGLGRPAPSFAAGSLLRIPDSPADGRTLVIFADATCGVCERGKSLIAEVVSRVGTLPDTRVRLITGASWPDSQRGYAHAIGVDKEVWSMHDLTALGVKRVPTVVLTGKDGAVIQSWDGLPSSASEIVDGVTSHSMTR